MKKILICTLFCLIWLCKPISYDTLVTRQYHRDSINISSNILTIRGGEKEETTFLNPRNKNPRPRNPRPPKPNPPKPNSADKKSTGLKLRYTPNPNNNDNKKNGDGIPDEEDLITTDNSDQVINNKQFWDKLEDETLANQKKERVIGNAELDKETLKKYDFTTRNRSPYTYPDRYGNPLTLKNKALKKSVYAHSEEAGLLNLMDKIPCPKQNNPALFQRRTCRAITDRSVDELIDKLKELTTSTKSNYIRLIMPMPYRDDQLASAYINKLTGECAFFKENGEFWTFKRYETKKQLDYIISKYKDYISRKSHPEF